MKRGKTVIVIADELEEEESKIWKIIKEIEKNIVIDKV